MELARGVFVSKLSTDQWEPDPDVDGQMHVLCTVDDAEAGLSQYLNDPREPVRYTLPKRETLLVLEGRATIEILDGPTLELKAGDIASLPRGAETTWHITAPYREFWVFG
jgi:ethanolamine utilization protein EutQ (cupin superfamily)